MDLPYLSILAVISTVCCSSAGRRSRGKPYRHSPWFRFLPKWFHFMSLPGFTWIAAVTYFNRISMIYGSLLLRGTFFSVICDPTRYSNLRTNVNIYNDFKTIPWRNYLVSTQVSFLRPYIAFSMFAALHLVELNTMFLSTPEVSGLVRQQWRAVTMLT